MAKIQVSITLNEDLVKRLDNLSQRTGKSKNFHAGQAIASYLDDMEDLLLAKDSLDAFRDSSEGVLSIDELDWDNGDR